MAAPNVINAASGANVTWGTVDAGGATGGGSGVWVNASLNKTGEVQPVLNGTGVPDGLVIIPGLEEHDKELYSAANVPGPNIGETVNVAGLANFFVKNVTFRWQQKGIKMQSVQATALP